MTEISSFFFLTWVAEISLTPPFSCYVPKSVRYKERRDLSFWADPDEAQLSAIWLDGKFEGLERMPTLVWRAYMHDLQPRAHFATNLASAAVTNLSCSLGCEMAIKGMKMRLPEFQSNNCNCGYVFTAFCSCNFSTIFSICFSASSLIPSFASSKTTRLYRLNLVPLG